jgi:hypothetical protein
MEWIPFLVFNLDRIYRIYWIIYFSVSGRNREKILSILLILSKLKKYN